VNVNDGASIKSNGLSVQAHNNAQMEGSIASGSNSKNNSDFFGVAAALTFADVKAEAHINQGARLTVANDLTVSATNVGRYANSVESVSGPNGTADVAVAYADHKSSANASLGADVGDAKNVSVLAIDEVQKDHAEAVAKVGSSELGSILNDIHRQAGSGRPHAPNHSGQHPEVIPSGWGDLVHRQQPHRQRIDRQ
jgi:hypothetical protein